MCCVVWGGVCACAQGDTGLIMAAFQGHIKIVQLLLSVGADPSVRGDQGKTAAEWARAQGHEAVATLIETFGRHALGALCVRTVFVCVFPTLLSASHHPALLSLALFVYRCMYIYIPSYLWKNNKTMKHTTDVSVFYLCVYLHVSVNT